MNVKLVRPLYTGAFFAMLRVSEITVTSKTDESGHALIFEDVTFHKMGDQGEMHGKIRSSKTDQKANSITEGNLTETLKFLQNRTKLVSSQD
jgi:hypothetical protein